MNNSCSIATSGAIQTCRTRVIPGVTADYRRTRWNTSSNTEASTSRNRAQWAGEKGECKASKGKVGATLANFSYVSDDEEQIAAALVKYGPLSIGINAAWMQSYLAEAAASWLCERQAPITAS